jgi:hypothetical protein
MAVRVCVHTTDRELSTWLLEELSLLAWVVVADEVADADIVIGDREVRDVTGRTLPVGVTSLELKRAIEQLAGHR